MAKIAVTPTIVAVEFFLFTKKISFQKVSLKDISIDFLHTKFNHNIE